MRSVAEWRAFTAGWRFAPPGGAEAGAQLGACW